MAQSTALLRIGTRGSPLALVQARMVRAGLAAALQSIDVAGVAPIPARLIAADAAGDVGEALLAAVPADLPASAARREIDARRARTPQDLAALLAPLYGQSFDSPIYIDGMALIAHLGLGDLPPVGVAAEQDDSNVEAVAAADPARVHLCSPSVEAWFRREIC